MCKLNHVEMLTTHCKAGSGCEKRSQRHQRTALQVFYPYASLKLFRTVGYRSLPLQQSDPLLNTCIPRARAGERIATRGEVLNLL